MLDSQYPHSDLLLQVWLPIQAAVSIDFSRQQTSLLRDEFIPVCLSMSCSSICLSRISNISIQQNKLCSASVSKSACWDKWTSSSDIDVLLESQSTTESKCESIKPPTRRAFHLHFDDFFPLLLLFILTSSVRRSSFIYLTPSPKIVNNKCKGIAISNSVIV